MQYHIFLLHTFVQICSLTLIMLKFQRTKFCSRIIITLVIVMLLMYLYSNFRLSYRYSMKKFSNNLQNIFEKQSFVPRELKRKPTNLKDVNKYNGVNTEIKIAVVLCGPRLNQTIVTLKSVVILSKSPLHFIIVTDEENRNKIKYKILEWPSHVLNRISYEIHLISFPNNSEGDEWKKTFKLCACQRLFLSSLLDHIDSIIYIDTDVLFMHPVENLWNYFHQMNESQIAGLAPEHEDFATGWYNRFARHPFYEPLGVNSGVMLMNLTRMRNFKWETHLQPIMREYKLKIAWGDQDIINIIFHFHSDKLFIFPCEWNYRPDHCMYSSVCKTAEKDGVKVIHGNRGVYQNNKQPAFKAIYKTMESFPIGLDIRENLLKPMEAEILKAQDTNCGKVHKLLLKSLKRFAEENAFS